MRLVMERLPGLAPRAFSALCAALLCIPGAALAQESASEAAASPEDDDEIVVTGRKSSEIRREIQRQARDVAVAEDFYREPLARFEARLCPGIMGLNEEHAGYMIDRLRYNAQELGLRIMPDGCAPNLIVVFTPDGQGMMKNMRESSGYLFQYLDAGEKRELFDEPGPVRVWTQVMTRTRDGMPVPETRDATNPPVARMDMAHSRIYTAVRRDIESVMILFDNAAVHGKTLVQLADYATMRGLAQTRPVPGEMPVGTILGLFEGDGPHPDELTEFDRAYLRSLYNWMANLPASAKVGGVNRQLRIMAREEEKAGR